MKVLTYSWSKFFSKINLPRSGIDFLQLCREVAIKKGYFLYLAGGPVRDIFLDRPVKDLDVVLEGDWETILPEILQKVLGRILFKTPFYTYKIELFDGLVFDLITARKETYPEPASLPVVEKATFKEDIMRRDFTINALIYGLTPPFEEKIVDLVSGLEDLKEGKITPLHLDSFIEDPTRALRGIRFKVRFQFYYDTIFYEALKRAQAASAFNKLSPSRLAKELKLFFLKEEEKNWVSLVRDLISLKLPDFFEIRIRELKENDLYYFKKARTVLNSKELEKFYLLSLIEIEQYSLERLNFSIEQQKKILKWYEYGIREIFKEEKDVFEKVESLEKIPLYVLYRLSLEEKFRPIFEVWEKFTKIKPMLNGDDLKKLGLTDGHEIAKILKEIRRKKFLGELKSKEDEITWVKEKLR
ncbi:MAG: hypothetical protein ACK4FM_03430, partial [Caldimicrobium sp.]